MDPYKILNVRKNARPASITKAFRKRSLQTHPDRGGNREEFEAVRAAYAILSDAAKRKRYDETGDCDDSPNNEDAAVWGVLSRVFGAVLAELIKISAPPSSQNMIVHMRKCLQDDQAKLATNRRQIEKTLTYLRDCLGRFTSKEGGFDSIINQHIQEVEKQSEAQRVISTLNSRALEKLETFVFLHETYQPFPATWHQMPQRRMMGILE